jgi:hypothetical protein
MKIPQIKNIFVVFVLGVCFGTAACDENAATQIAQTNSATKANVNAATAPPPATNTATALNQEPPKLDVPYVPTHETVVDEMLRMANVKGDDVLYDLGSGDGRIPITAAKRFGTRGVGIDLNPMRIKEANENAEKAGVANKVRFVQGDLFKENFSEATVLTLYLLPDVNLKLRPKILEMKPGTRVVSHNYDMGDWQPDDVKIINTPDGVDHVVYFWRVPSKK